MQANQRNIMKLATVIAAACFSSGITPVFAVTLNFEDLPLLYQSSPFVAGGGNTDIGAYYPAVTFGAGVQGIGSSASYPTHSGSTQIWQSDINNPTIAFDLHGSFNSVSFWYNTLFGFTETAFDSGNHVIGTFVAAPNTDGANSSGPSFADITTSVPIDHVFVVDSASVGSFSSLDDLTLTNSAVPNSTSTLALLGISGMALLAFRRKIVTQ
jgi:hypothetical protein